jgi:cytochrome c oxidase subunit 4
MTTPSQHHIVPIKIYIAIFLALMAGTALTVYAAFQDFGPMNVLIALTIAVVKGTLVVLYFMHVRYSDKLTWVVVGSGFLWLGILFALTLSDYFARHWLFIYGP